MRVLVFGAGVIGSIYGMALARSGHHVTLLARGHRKAQLEASGLSLENALTGERWTGPLAVTDEVRSDVDLVIVALRDDQLESAVAQLQGLPRETQILILSNCPMRVASLREALGPARTLFAFPGAGGVHSVGVVRYTIVAQQPTTFGPVAGGSKRMPADLARMFRAAGFPTAVVADMEAWLRTHAVLIAALCGALYAGGGRSRTLARNREGLNAIIDAISEGLRVVRALGFTPSPIKVVALAALPNAIGRRALARMLASDLAEVAIDGHANAAPDDMAALARDCRNMVAASGTPAPTLLRLCTEVEGFASAAATRGTKPQPLVLST